MESNALVAAGTLLFYIRRPAERSLLFEYRVQAAGYLVLEIRGRLPAT